MKVNVVNLVFSFLMISLSACVETSGRLQPAEIEALQAANNAGRSIYHDGHGKRGYQNTATVDNYGTSIEYQSWSYGGDPQPATDLRPRDNSWNQYDHYYNRDWERYPQGYENARDRRQYNNCQYSYIQNGDWKCR